VLTESIGFHTEPGVRVKQLCSFAVATTVAIAVAATCPPASGAQSSPEVRSASVEGVSPVHPVRLVAEGPGPEAGDGSVEGEAAPPPTERVILPVLLYTPETKLGGGAVAAGYRRLQPDLPVSSLLGAVTVTARRQISLGAVSQLHRPGGGRVDASVRFEHFPDRFFGVGPGTPDEAEEAYTSRSFDAKLRGQRQVAPGLRVGLQATFRWEDVVETEETGSLAAGDLTAPDGGRWFGVGAVATFDTRDHVVNPRRGVYAELSALAYPEAFGTTGYRSAVLDARGFLPLGAASTLAFRAYLNGSGGEVPVLLLPSLGGRERLRGYYDGRVRDRVAGAAQGEVRFPLWGRFGGVAFAEAGQVGPRLGDLASGQTELSAGAGLRFRLGGEAAPIRADFAVGRRGSGLYLTIGEAF
jgi:hypothetical protein